MWDLSLHLMDIVRNSLDAGASFISIEIEENREDSELILSVSDDGQGIPAELIENVFDPFYTTKDTRDTGLGLSLLKMSCTATGGDCIITSSPGQGTTLTAKFNTASSAMPNLGDINLTLRLLIESTVGVDFVYTRKCKGHAFSLDTREITAILGGVSITASEVLEWIDLFLQEQTQNITGGLDDNENIEGTRRDSR